MIITGDTLQPSSGNNISVPNGMGINVNNTEVLEIGSTGIIAQQPYACFVDEKANGTGGGQFDSGGWRTRVLNTTRGTNSISGSSLNTSLNQFTLPSGTYRIFATAPVFAVNLHKAKLRNITDSSDTLIGTNARGDQTYNGVTPSIVSGIFTITSSKTFEIQHYCSTTYVGGFGQATSFGVVEIYTQVELWKLGN